MQKTFLLILIIIGLVVSIVFAVILGLRFKKSLSGPPSSFPVTESSEHIIQGGVTNIGSWVRYKLEGFQKNFVNNKQLPQINEIIAKPAKMQLNNEELVGIEIEAPEQNLLFFLAWDKRSKEYVLVKTQELPTLCFPSPTRKGFLEIWSKDNLKNEYEVDQGYKFDGEMNILLDNGKNIRARKYLREQKIRNGIQKTTVWLSKEVPLYLVRLEKQTILNNQVDEKRVVILSDFSFERAQISFGREDFEICKFLATLEIPQDLVWDVQKRYCLQDEDCACGKDKEGGKCIFGNAEFIEETDECFNFCIQFQDYFKIKCVNKLCTAQPSIK